MTMAGFGFNGLWISSFLFGCGHWVKLEFFGQIGLHPALWHLCKVYLSRRWCTPPSRGTLESKRIHNNNNPSGNPNPHSSIGNSKIYIKLLCENSQECFGHLFFTHFSYFYFFLWLTKIYTSLYIHFSSCCWINIHKIRNSTIINSYSIVFCCLFLILYYSNSLFSHLGWFSFFLVIFSFSSLFCGKNCNQIGENVRNE